MNINLTLLVQIGNFWITYYFLSKILLKPALALLEREQSELCRRRQLIVEHEHELSIAIRKKREQWLDYQRGLREKFPTLSLSKKQLTSGSVSLTPLGESKKERLVHEIANAIVHEVSA